jgi:aromatic-L-amino-acid decarboxylase
MDRQDASFAETSLDAADDTPLRALGHRMIDDLFDHLAALRAGPVWRPMPAAVRALWQAPLPREAGSAEAAYDVFREAILPYSVGNLHPGFMGWVHGGGTAVGMLAELLAGGLNANLGGRDHAPIAVERQVVRWAAEMLGLPEHASGLLVTGTSIANFIGLLVARTACLGGEVRAGGLRGAGLVAYASAAAHGCIARAMDMAGLGTDALRLVACDAAGRLDMTALRARVARDRQDGATPFLVVGTAGTVDTGAIDPLAEVAAFCREAGIWFHVDGAFGALAALSPALRPRLAGIEQADSVAFDFHKWAQVPYDCGCILVRDPARQEAAFGQSAAYLRREARGLAGGAPWPCDLGPDLSRGFRALKVWMTVQSYGADRLGAVVEHTCALARLLAARVAAEPRLELLAPVALNIVCFRLRPVPGIDTDARNAAVVVALQEAGLAAPSTTMVDGRLAIRAAIVNHRTRAEDVQGLVDAVLALA